MRLYDADERVIWVEKGLGFEHLKKKRSIWFKLKFKILEIYRYFRFKEWRKEEWQDYCNERPEWW